MIVFINENIHVFFFTTQKMMANIVMYIYFESCRLKKYAISRFSNIWKITSYRIEEKKKIWYCSPETQRVLFTILYVFCLEICLQISHKVLDFLCFLLASYAGEEETLL